jgi:hypothetical protein
MSAPDVVALPATNCTGQTERSRLCRSFRGRALPNQLILLSHHSSLLMPHHQFHVGQTVHLWRPALAGYAAVGAYEIRAVLPEQEGRRRYRIKSLIEPHERVVSEIELSEA